MLLKYGYFKEIYLYHNKIDYLKLFSTVHNHYSNPEFGSEYNIIKTQMNNIVCLNKKSKYIDLKEIHPFDIQYMRIHYKSFCPNTTIDETNIISISKQIIDEIVNYVLTYNLNVYRCFDNYEQIDMYDLPYDTNNILITNTINLSNLNILLIKLSNAKNNINKLSLLKQVSNYIYNNIDIIMSNQFLINKIKHILNSDIHHIYLLINKYILDENYIQDNKLISIYDSIIRLLLILESNDNIKKILNNNQSNEKKKYEFLLNEQINKTIIVY